MSGPLSHSPAYVLRQALVDLGLGTNPPDNADWPVVARKEPDEPDNVITVYNSAGRDLGRTGPDQRRVELYGIQVRVRAGTPSGGDSKARAIAGALDAVYLRAVVVEGSQYELAHFIRSTGVLDLGVDSPVTNRSVLVVNGLLSLSMAL
jgi:hypothetical protein